MAARIVGVGKYLPSRVLTNADLESMVETSDEWIVERTGIKERRIAADEESAATLGTRAALMALETAGLTPDQIDLVICATLSPDAMFPASASLIQEGIGAGTAAAFDVNAACNGFMAALATGAQFIDAGAYERVLVVGAEAISRIIDWTDRSTCILFGDGAGAVVLERGEGGGVESFVLKNDGAGASLLYARGPASSPASSVLAGESFCVVMDGREVFKFAVRAMEEATREAAQKAGISLDEITYLVPHQANLRIMNGFARALDIGPERVISNVARYGNTSSASIPIALCEAWEEGRLTPGDHLVFVAVGGGLSWGASVVEWTGVGSRLATANAEAASR
jgi:3-oxoacyl-[acyl-carrier-protein] synthase-3